jgi:hypothetical protein
MSLLITVLVAALAVLLGKAISLLFKDSPLKQIAKHNQLYNTLSSETAKREIKKVIDMEAKTWTALVQLKLSNKPFAGRLVLWLFLLISWMILLNLLLIFTSSLTFVFIVPAWFVLSGLALFLCYELWQILSAIVQAITARLSKKIRD